MTVVIAGPINMDLNIRIESYPLPGEEIAGYDFSYSPGGKALNQAVAAVRVGSRVRVVGWLGSDIHGSDLLNFLQRESIDSSFVHVTTDHYTPLSVVLVDSSGENRIIYDARADFQDRLGERLTFSAGDIFLCQLGLSAASRLKMLKKAREKDALSILNAAPDPEPLQSGDCEPDILAVNEHELHMLTQALRDVPLEYRIKATRPLRTIATIVTLGAAGVFLYQDESLLHIPGVQVETVDTAGAGDAFLGALAAQLDLGRDLPQSATYATRYAALSVTKRGAAVSMPLGRDVDDFE